MVNGAVGGMKRNGKATAGLTAVRPVSMTGLEAEVARRLREGLGRTGVVESIATLFWNTAHEVGLAPEEEAAFRDSVRGVFEEVEAGDGRYMRPTERGLSERGEAMFFVLMGSMYDSAEVARLTEYLARVLEEEDREALRRACWWRSG